MSEGFQLRNRVKELRSRLGLRQADLAREVDVTRQTIIAIEKGKLNPSIFICLKIARILREPVDYVFYLDRGAAPADFEPAPAKPARASIQKEAVPVAAHATADAIASNGDDTKGNGHRKFVETVATPPAAHDEAAPAAIVADAAEEPSFNDDPAEDAPPKTVVEEKPAGGNQVTWDF